MSTLQVLLQSLLSFAKHALQAGQGRGTVLRICNDRRGRRRCTMDILCLNFEVLNLVLVGFLSC